MAFTLQIGDYAPDFKLMGTDDKFHVLEDFDDCKILIVVFTCNHCPAAQGVENRLKQFYDRYAPKGVGVVGINSNEDQNHPDDSFPNMKTRKREKRLPWTYLRDEDQSVALAYGALRTPHFYVFDRERKLRYTGRFDDNPRDEAAATTHEVADAVNALLNARDLEVKLTNPIGCNVKWKGKDAHWMPPEACDLV